MPPLGKEAWRLEATFQSKILQVACYTLSPTRQMWWQVWEGEGVVASARKLIGATNPLNAEPGTIRGDLAGTFLPQ